MAYGISTYWIQSTVVLLFSTIQEVWGAICNTGYTYYNKYTTCFYGCCSSYITNYKCCSSSSSTYYYKYYYTYYNYTGYYYLSTGSIAGIVISALVGIGILISLIVCCACSKKRYGRVIRTGGVGGGPNVTVVNSSMMQQGGMSHPPQTISYNNNYSYPPPPGGTGPGFYNPPPSYPLQPMNNLPQGMPPSYSQVTSQNPPTDQNGAPPAYAYTNPVAPQSGPYSSSVINVSPYPK